jgi:ubiquinone/menaquinone biosynthesis C-methylase UbiE
MAEGLLRSWFDRLRGQLRPIPMPYSRARDLEMPGRGLVAGPARILGAFGLGVGERLLEIGPGIGYYSVDAARRVGPSGRLFCLDIQGEMLRDTRRRLSAANLAADAMQASALALPLRDRSVDRVFLIAVLGEIPDRSAGLAEIRRVLRVGGRLSVAELMPDPDFIPRATLRRELSAAGFVEESTRGFLWYTSTWRVVPA